MDTDLDRLKAWIEANDYGNKSLSHALDYSGDCVSGVVSGKVAINHSFKQRFGRTFGREALDAIFQVAPVLPTLESFGNWQEHGKAHGAVAKEIRTGKMPHPTNLKCHGCNKQAQLYHHESYHPDYRLCVTPLCRTCHRRHHTGKRKLTFGVVPTQVGLIRIAIAGS